MKTNRILSTIRKLGLPLGQFEANMQFTGRDEPVEKCPIYPALISVSWEEIRGTGMLIARCEEAGDLNVKIEHAEPIHAGTDSHSIAHKVTSTINRPVNIVAVDHDGTDIFIVVTAKTTLG